jgi:RND family efflux transporter MFP subunit
MLWTLPFPRRVVFALPVVLMILPLGCKKEEESPAEEEHAAPVKWETAEKADLEEWTELLGTTQPLPSHVAHISAAVGGRVLSVLPSEKDKAIVEGQRIDKGQILVQLDDRVLRASRQKLVAGDAELQEQTRQAEHAVELARIEIDRLDRLQRTSGGSVPLVTRLEMEKARLAYKDAESKRKGAEAKEAVAHAEVKMIDEELGLYTMRTPIAGQLGIVHASPGQTLALGATVAEVINLDEIDVLCFVPARTVAHLELGQEVRIEEDGEHAEDKTKAEPGSIVFISDQAQAETGTVAIKARFANQKRKLRANTLLRVRVLTKKKPGCLTIPEAALLEDQEKPAVLVVATQKKKDKDGKETEEEEQRVHKYEAELGLRDHKKQRVEILGLFEVEEEKKKPVPLEADTLFVVEGGHGLEDKDLVTLKKEEEDKEEDAKKDEPKEGGTKKDEPKKSDEQKDKVKEDDQKNDEHK